MDYIENGRKNHFVQYFAQRVPMSWYIDIEKKNKNKWIKYFFSTGNICNSNHRLFFIFECMRLQIYAFKFAWLESNRMNKKIFSKLSIFSSIFEFKMNKRDLFNPLTGKLNLEFSGFQTIARWLYSNIWFQCVKLIY